MIIAPHEIHEEHLQQLKQLFPDSIFFSQLTTHCFCLATRSRNYDSPSNCLIIDNIGMFSRLYHYATITYIGGGFEKEFIIHWKQLYYGKPVLFGPNYKKFREAIELISSGGGISVGISKRTYSTEIKNCWQIKKNWRMFQKDHLNLYKIIKGATEMIIMYIQEKRRF